MSRSPSTKRLMHMKIKVEARTGNGFSPTKPYHLWLMTVCIFSAAILFFVVSGIVRVCQAAVQSVPAPQEDVPAPPQANIEAAGDTSSPWRSFLWEALPSEWLADPRKDTILEAYQRNGWKPLFIDSNFSLTSNGNVFMRCLENLGDDAIDPKPYHLAALKADIQNLRRLRESLESDSPRFYDHLTLLLDGPQSDQTASKPEAVHVHYAANSPAASLPPDTRPHRIDRQKLKEILQTASQTDVRMAQDLIQYALEMNPYSKEYQIKMLSGEITIEDFLKHLTPALPRYAVLQKALKKYELLASQDSQPFLADQTTLRPGFKGDSIERLQKRLQQEGYYDGSIDGYYDAATQAAVQRFQKAHMQDPDGVVGPGTRNLLNIKYEKKAEMISQSMKTMRNSEARRYEKFVWINLPQFILEYYNCDKLESMNRVIVGKASGKKVKFHGRWVGENHTPSLASSIENVILNPRWYVSDRIRKELSNEIAADPSYLVKNGYVQMTSTYPWGEPRIFQQPGPNNPLGIVKFEFANPYAIFLHDTPKKSLFQRTRRDFSHGCIRMDKAQEFAHILLSDDQNPAVGKMSYYLANRSQQSVIKLQQPVPIIIDYLVVSSDESNHVLFCGDLYGREE